MKKILYSIFCLMAFELSSCNNAPIGQTPTDSTPPASITAPVIENQAGGAKISYTLPKETDISYVRAEYMYKGKLTTTKSTVYKNFVIIEGFGSTDPVDVNLYTVDHSNNESAPVKVTIKPLTPPVYGITQSFKWVRDFGGFKLNWENTTGSEVVLTLLKKGTDGLYHEEDTYYTSAKEGIHNFRGFDNVASDFGIYVRDKFYNISDTVKFNLTPIREVQIPTKNFARILDIPADNHSQLWGWEFVKLWDDIYPGDTGWHTDDGNGGKRPLYWTIDMGLTAKLSRFTIWHRTSIPYGHQNLKKFEVWGATEYEKGKPDAYWRKGGGWETDGHWTLIGTFEIKKPSGLEGTQVTAEDVTAMNDGFEFQVPLVVKPIRYVRFAMLSNFSGGYDVHIAEIKFFGDDTAGK